MSDHEAFTTLMVETGEQTMRAVAGSKNAKLS